MDKHSPPRLVKIADSDPDMFSRKVTFLTTIRTNITDLISTIRNR
jgi:hypothetical protein